MAKTANRIELTYDGEYVSSASITTDKLSRVEATDGSDNGNLVNFTKEPVAKWTVEAQESAAYLLINDGRIVLNGVSISDKVIGRVARIAGEKERMRIFDGSAIVPRPQSKTELREATIATMVADGASQDDVIAWLLAN